MKKILIGCGIVALVVFLVCGGIVGFFSYRVVQLMGDFERAAASIASVERNHPFTEPPEGTRLSDNTARFDTFLQVREDVGTHVRQIPLIAQMIDADQEQPAIDPTPMEFFRMIGQIPKAMEDIAQTMDDQQMSFSEYGWYVTGILAAIREGAALGDNDLATLWTDMEEWAAEAESQIRMQLQQQQQDIDFRPEAAWQSVEDRTAALEDVNLIRQRSEELLRNPGLLIVELYLTQFARQQ